MESPDPGTIASKPGDAPHPMRSRRARILAVVVAGVALAICGGAAAWFATRPTVPSVVEMAPADAAGAISDAGLTAAVHDSLCVDLPREACAVSSQTPDAGKRVDRGSEVVLVLRPIEVQAPSLTGLTFAQAEAAASDVWLEVSMAYQLDDPDIAALADAFGDERRQWQVGSQEVSAGAVAHAGQSIELTLVPPDVTVPTLAGMTASEALEALKDAGLQGTAPARVTTATFTVAGQDPAPGSRQPFGAKVELAYDTQVPDLSELDPAEAKKALVEAGLLALVAPKDADWDWNFVSQSPAPGTRVPVGTGVTVNYEAAVIEYKVTGNGSRAAITWIPPGSYSVSQNTGASVPWSVTFPYSGYDIYQGKHGNFSAQATNGTRISCTLTVDGRVVDEQTSTGRYSIVVCSM